MSKVMPHDLEIEKIVLGSLLCMEQENEKNIGILTQLKADWFYNTNHKLVMDAILCIHKRNKPFDIISVSNYLQNEDKLQAIGGRAFINDLALDTPSSSLFEYYTEKLKEHYIRRQVIKIAESIKEEVYTNKDVLEITNNVELMLGDIIKNNVEDDFIHIRDLSLDIYHDSEKALNDEEVPLKVIKTGFRDLDNEETALGGLYPGQLIIIGARPSMGKTSFAVNIATNAAIDGSKVAVFSLETNKNTLATRILTSISEIQKHKLRHSKQLDCNDWSKLTNTLEILNDANLYISDTACIKVSEIKARCKKLQYEKGLDLVVIDYLQLIEPDSQKAIREQEVAKMSRQLKIMAKELDIPVLLLSQLSRNVESRADKRPMLSDLRESGAIEQDADVVMFIYRDEHYYPEDLCNKGKAEIIIAKNKENGAGISIDFLFDSRLTKFKDKLGYTVNYGGNY